MITGTGTLPKPTSFVSRNGQGLYLDGSPYRIVGPNIYWLCNDENVFSLNAPTDKGVSPNPPSDEDVLKRSLSQRVREALAIAVAMGGNTLRLTSCSTSVGSQYSVEPSLGQFSNANVRMRSLSYQDLTDATSTVGYSRLRDLGSWRIWSPSDPAHDGRLRLVSRQNLSASLALTTIEQLLRVQVHLPSLQRSRHWQLWKCFLHQCGRYQRLPSASSVLSTSLRRC